MKANQGEAGVDSQLIAEFDEDLSNTPPSNLESDVCRRRFDGSIYPRVHHLIYDNYATHKHPNVQAWLEKHPRFHVHQVAHREFGSMAAISSFFPSSMGA